jgi:hypothetical protein
VSVSKVSFTCSLGDTVEHRVGVFLFFFGVIERVKYIFYVKTSMHASIVALVIQFTIVLHFPLILSNCLLGMSTTEKG